jgi:hypothetical protein
LSGSVVWGREGGEGGSSKLEKEKGRVGGEEGTKEEEKIKREQ